MRPCGTSVPGAAAGAAGPVVPVVPVVPAAADDAAVVAAAADEDAAAAEDGRRAGASASGIPGCCAVGESTGTETVGSPSDPTGSPIWSTPPVQAQASVVATERTKAVGTAAI
ncbi:hypothetical protein Aab01nite_75520 [Paractinoplanes abujensis]|nr:hypothetical protein Aab01nite_75520 [Actinoplanes abujensis]